MISLEDQETSVSVQLGERVTVRVEECLSSGLMWSNPNIVGSGVSLVSSRSMSPAGADITEYREFTFATHHVGKNYITSFLKQAGVEEGIKRFLMIIDVTENTDQHNEG